MLFRKTAVSVNIIRPQFNQLMPGPCQINDWLLARRTKTQPVARMPRTRDSKDGSGAQPAAGRSLFCGKNLKPNLDLDGAQRERPPWEAVPVMPGTVFHYTSINVWTCSAVKCAGYLSRKVESADATIDGGWGKISVRA